jgi:hypothetical protein
VAAPDDTDVADDEPVRVKSAAAGGAPAANPGADESTVDGGASETGADAGVAAAEETADEAEGEAEGEPTTVTITLEGLPPAAKATIDGKPVDSPFTMPRSDTPGLLRVTAPGFEVYQMALALDRTQIVELGMIEASEDKTGKKTGGKKKHKAGDDGFKMWKPKKKGSKGLMESPFKK